MVDTVITWVDGNDLKHREKRLKYMTPSDGMGSATDRRAVLDTRFNDCGEIYYTIRLIRLNAPWIDTIYLVTDGQRPHWLSDQEARALNITLVDHQVIFRGFEQCLPTFNSRSIETVIHRIPRLSSRFIYFNDDCFIIRPVEEAEYFEGKAPKFRASLEYRPFPWRFISNWKPRKEPMKGIVGLRLGSEKILRGKRTKAALYHVPYPIDTQSYAATMANRIAKNAKYRFRSNEQFSPVSLYANLMLQGGKCEFVEPDFAYLDPEIDACITPRSIREGTASEKIKHLCIQSLDQYDQPSRSAALAFLKELIENPK